jgi:hypothetical protein
MRFCRHAREGEWVGLVCSAGTASVDDQLPFAAASQGRGALTYAGASSSSSCAGLSAWQHHARGSRCGRGNRSDWGGAAGRARDATVTQCVQRGHTIPWLVREQARVWTQDRERGREGGGAAQWLARVASAGTASGPLPWAAAAVCGGWWRRGPEALTTLRVPRSLGASGGGGWCRRAVGPTVTVSATVARGPAP